MKFRSIRSSLIGAFALVIVLGTVLLGGFTLALMRQTLVENTQSTTHQLVAQLQRVVDGYIGYMEDIAQVVVNNDDVQELLNTPRGGQEGARARTAAFLAGIRKVRRDIDSILLRTSGGLVVTSEPGRPLNPHWIDRQKTETYRGGSSISPARVENFFDDEYTWVISLRQQVGGPAASLGFVQVDLNYAIINDLCRQVQLGRSGYVFIVNSEGEIVFHPRQQLVYSRLKTEKIDDILKLRSGEIRARIDGQDLIYSVTTSPRTGWTIVGVSFADEILAGTRNIEYTVWMVALGCFLVTVLVAWAMSLWISRPIEVLRKSMQVVETGNFDIEIRVDAQNEIGQLAEDCDIAIKKVRDLLVHNEKEQELKRRLSLLMLQSQINPHFLYNTLDSIIWMIELGETKSAISMTSSLAKFFRLGVSRGNEIISIRHEVSHVESYLSILKLRYQSKLAYSIDIDRSLYDYRILKLLLQPLVENALYHGLKPKDGPGLIEVGGRLESGGVKLWVKDDGVGMDLEKARARMESESFEEDDHVGLKNVHQRIRLYFGQDYGLSFEQGPEGGTVVIVRLPAIYEGEPS